jgi:hypothetical protein
MNRVVVVLGVLSVGLAAGSARAQGVYQQPMVGMFGNQAWVPYINLLRGGNTAVNYFGITRPVIQGQASLQYLQTEVNRQQFGPTVAPPRNRGVSETGAAPARFMQYNQYFNTLQAPRAVNYQTVPGSQAATYGRR